VGVNPASGVVFISEVSDATDYHNEYIEFYNSGSEVCLLTNASLKRINGGSSTTWGFYADLVDLGDIKIPAGGFLIMARDATSQASFESEWGALPSSCNFNKGKSTMYFGTSTQYRWQLIYDDGIKADVITDDTDNPVGGDGNDSKQNDDGTWTTTGSTTSSNPGSLAGDDGLPIELLSFTAKSNHSNIEISWQTASEVNNNYFVLESSSEGINFDDLTQVSGAGNSNEIKNYSFTDNRVHSGIVYYRLKQVDYDGKFTYSKIISANNSLNKLTLNNVYTDDSKLLLNIDNTQNSMAEVEIIDVTGRVIKTFNLQLIKGQSNYSLFIGYHLTGVYMIKIENLTTSIIRKAIL